MLFVAAIRGTQAVWRRLVAVTILYCQKGASIALSPCVDIHCCSIFFHGANTDKSFKCASQASLAQRLCSGAERGSVNQLSLYTSPSLPNITLGLPATATATAASNVRRKLLPSKLQAD